MTDNNNAKPAMTPDRARAEARKMSEASRLVANKIKTAKAKHAASRPKPRVAAKP